MSSRSLIRILATFRPRNSLLIPANLALVAYLYLITKTSNLAPLCNLLHKHALWIAKQPNLLVQRLPKDYRDPLCSKKKALLIGIRSVADVPMEAEVPSGIATHSIDAAITSTAPDISNRPRGPIKQKRKGKKSKSKSSQSQLCPLKGPHHDVLAMRDLLISKYNYREEDVVVLIDDGETCHLQPSKSNIIEQIMCLVRNVRDGDKLFFHYSGHADQEDTDDVTEEDGKDEYIFTCDGLKIMDNELYDALVDSLIDIKCDLTAIFDCCHSGSLLGIRTVDLPHSHCNDVYVPWLNKGRRRTKTMWANCLRDGDILTPPQSPTKTEHDWLPLSGIISSAPVKGKSKPGGLVVDISKCYPTPPPSSYHSRHPSSDIPSIGITNATPPPIPLEFISPQQYTVSPSALYRYCNGMCRDDLLQDFGSEKTRRGVEVICISASKDSELAWEDGEGRSMTQYLVHNLERNPRPTLHGLLTAISHDIHAYYVSELHQAARKYKKEVQKLGIRDEDLVASVVEMHNFQNPQLSSRVPLNMDQVFNP